MIAMQPSSRTTERVVALFAPRLLAIAAIAGVVALDAGLQWAASPCHAKPAAGQLDSEQMKRARRAPRNAIDTADDDDTSTGNRRPEPFGDPRRNPKGEPSMNATLSASFGCLAVALAFAASPGFAADPLRDGFDRMLAPRPAAAHAPAVPQGPADPLTAALVAPLRDGVTRAPAARPNDPVAESFARMLSHEPHWAAPALPAGTGTDPLIAAVARPLLRAPYGTLSVPLARR